MLEMSTRTLAGRTLLQAGTCDRVEDGLVANAVNTCHVSAFIT